MAGWKDLLPDFKKALTGFYEENVKQTIETKTNEFKELIKHNAYYGQNTQKALIAIAFGTFLLLAIAYFWKDEPHQPIMKNLKYIAIGILVGYLGLYVYGLSQTKLATNQEN